MSRMKFRLAIFGEALAVLGLAMIVADQGMSFGIVTVIVGLGMTLGAVLKPE